jgi:hypothetical protein
MVGVLFIMVLLLSLGAIIHTGVIGETALRGAHARSTNGFYAAEGGLNLGAGATRNIFLAYGLPTAAAFEEKVYPLGDRTVRYRLTELPGNPQQVKVPAGRPFAGLNAIRYRYTATSSAEHFDEDVEARLGVEFDVDYIPLFQFLAFYAGDLEILPGPDMTLNGPIHTNGNLYLNAGGTLTIAESAAVPTVHVTAAGDVHRGRLDMTACEGTVSIAKLEDADKDGALDRVKMPCAGLQSDTALSQWAGAIRSHQPVLSVPTFDLIARGSGDLWRVADLRLVLDLSAADANGRFPIVVQRADGTVDVAKNAVLQAFLTTMPGRLFYSDVPRPGHDADNDCAATDSYCNRSSYTPAFSQASDVYACAGSSLGLYASCTTNVPTEALSTGGVTARRGGFYNNREHAWTYLLNLNLHDLLVWNRLRPADQRLFVPDDASEAGVVIFASVAGPGSTGAIPSPRYGVRVFGTPDLDFPAGADDPTGVTVVSDQAMYVEGNYNVGDAAHPWQPAALIGDTLNVLSNNWSGDGTCRNDCQSRKPLGSRSGTATTINAAFMAGVDVTAPGSYNGGFENYPRFHEGWSGTLRYRGSFVSLGKPRRANGPWCGTGGTCNIYNPPPRDWNYDARFQRAENLPPMTPRVVSLQQIFFAETFR